MANFEKIYSNTTASLKANALINFDKLNYLLDAKDGSSALKILAELGFGDGAVVSNSLDFELLCEAEEKNLFDFIEKFAVTDEIKQLLNLKAVYHNLKACVKAKFFKKVDLKACAVSYVLPNFEEVAEKVASEEYGDFSLFIQSALTKLSSLNAVGNLSPQKIDVILDKAYYDELFDLLEKIDDKKLTSYYKIEVDIKNISICARSLRFDLNPVHTLDILFSNVTISKDIFVKFLEVGLEKIVEEFVFTPYKELLMVLAENNETSFVRFETIADNLMFDIYKKDKFMPTEGIDPFIAFVLAKNIVIKNVRLIMVCLNNNIDKNQIRERLRVTYG